jgi:hypothetical protein
VWWNKGLGAVLL